MGVTDGRPSHTVGLGITLGEGCLPERCSGAGAMTIRPSSSELCFRCSVTAPAVPAKLANWGSSVDSTSMMAFQQSSAGGRWPCQDSWELLVAPKPNVAPKPYVFPLTSTKSASKFSDCLSHDVWSSDLLFGCHIQKWVPLGIIHLSKVNHGICIATGRVFPLSQRKCSLDSIRKFELSLSAQVICYDSVCLTCKGLKPLEDTKLRINVLDVSPA